jgi:peptidyl-tRNA hydrolase ICT1
MLRRVIPYSPVSIPPPLPAVRPSLPFQRYGSSATGDEVQAARAWLAELHAETIPLKSIGELSFSRSSGPGGQNVNKYDTPQHTLTRRYTECATRVNSKATLKVPLDALLHHVPAALHGHVRRSRYVAAKSHTIIVQADDSRKQSDNAQSCYRRLYEAIAQAGQDAVPAETSAAQVQRVKHLYVLVVSDSPSDGPKADKRPDKSQITSAASRARNSRALRRRRGEAGVTSEAVCGEAACHSTIQRAGDVVLPLNCSPSHDSASMAVAV